MRLPVFDRRRAGVLLPMSALDAALGRGGRAFVDWLSEAAFSVWQVLPGGPGGGGRSPPWGGPGPAGKGGVFDAGGGPPSHAPLAPRVLWGPRPRAAALPPVQ